MFLVYMSIYLYLYIYGAGRERDKTNLIPSDKSRGVRVVGVYDLPWSSPTPLLKVITPLYTSLCLRTVYHRVRPLMFTNLFLPYIINTPLPLSPPPFSSPTSSFVLFLLLPF